ncbi:MAG: hypothetical protein DBX47_04295 [Clostridiales bacterium]|nr:MAG: hypothetical protein DBX47_04295 [Clostridiales bacterium]
MESDEKPNCKGEDKLNNKTEKKQKQKTFNIKWAIRAFILSFIVAALMSVVSEGVSSGNVNIWLAVMVLCIFIFIGLVFDVLGVSVAAANCTPFNSMATKKVKGAKTALWLTTRADTVSSFCNDVIGDVANVLSGTMSAVIAAEISYILNSNTFITMILVTSIISAITVSIKALGKNFAIKRNNDIVFFFAKIICLIVPEKVFRKK